MAFQFVKPTQKIEQVMVKNRFFQSVMLTYYKKIVSREIKISDMKKEDRVLCIGGGYFPCTAILLHKITGAKVRVIDSDEKTICDAKKVIEKMNLADKVEVLNVNGTEISAKEFDIVHIAMQVSPKIEVFEKIKKTTVENTKILTRIPKKRLKSGYHVFTFDEKEVKSIKQPFYSNIERTIINVV